MKNLQIILNAILSKNVFEYILVDKELKVLQSSDGIEKYLSALPRVGSDSLEYLPELVGNEEEVKKIFTKRFCLYSLESVHKNEYFVNISIEYCDENTAIILLHNITATTLSKQKILQYSNESTLLCNTLQKVIDHQNTYLFVVNNKQEIEFANQKFIEYFEAKDINELREMSINLCDYFEKSCLSYNELFKFVKNHEDSITINDDTFLLRATSIDLTHKLFTLSKVTNIVNKTYDLEVELQTDPLTQIYRKSYFDGALEKELAYDNNLALVVIDIDDFKIINDNHGHSVGDIVLKEFTDVIKNHLRSDDIFARWGGEEFLILLKRTNAKNALRITQDICKIIEEHTFSDIGHITASFGLSVWQEGDDRHTLLHKADKALYEAKANGKNQVVFKND